MTAATSAPKEISKVVSSPQEALQGLCSGMRLMSGGFGLCGIPENSIHAIGKMHVTNLEVVSNNIGNSGRGLVEILVKDKIKKAYCSYVGGNPDFEKRLLAEEIDVELIPQGTFSERIRAGGLGIRAFYTPTGYGTLIAEGKEVKHFDKPCILETALTADYAIIKAEKGDPYGNLWFKETARNFSPLMAMAASTTVVEVEELVGLGDIPPEDVHLPGLFVQHIYQGQNYANDIEFRKISDEKNEDKS